MYPQQLGYTKGHQWISFEEQYAFMGITDFAQRKLAHILAVDIPYLNKTVSRTLSDFKDEGLIDKKGGPITILDLVRLTKMKN